MYVGSTIESPFLRGVACFRGVCVVGDSVAMRTANDLGLPAP